MTDLIIDDLTVEYDADGYTVRPLDGFTTTVADGALAVQLGPSGCGKTTLLSCLGGILTPTSGSIHYGDTDIAQLDSAGLTRHRQERVGIVFQAFNLIPSLSALGNVTAPMRAAGVNARSATERAHSLLDRVGLSDRVGHRPSEMSGGQQQRVSLARALAHDPPLVIADEPTASLDYVQVEGVLRLLRELASPGRVVVVATHDDRLLPLADQVIEMVPKFRDEGAPIRTELAHGDELFAQGSRGTRIWVVEAGEIAIIREDGHGHEQQLACLDAGEHFGEMGPLFGLPRSASARAATDAVVMGYTVEQFRQHVGVERLTDLIRTDATT